MLFAELRLYRDTAAKDVLSVPFLQTLKEKSLGKNEHDAFFLPARLQVWGLCWGGSFPFRGAGPFWLSA